MKQIILSGIVIAKNAENIIGDCLTSLSFCDEIIVIDAYSSDKTVAIAKKLGARVVQGTEGNFAKQRNIGKEKAKGKWILYIDTDERITPELEKHILSVIHTESAYDAYKIKRKNFYLGNNPWPTIEKLERLFKKDSLEGWFGQLHETAKVKGTVGELDGFLLHYTHRDLESMLEKTIAWSEQEAKLRFDAHHPQMTWWRFPRVMLTAFWESYIAQKGWKAGTSGLIESIYQAYSIFITYAKLWEMQLKAQKRV